MLKFSGSDIFEKPKRKTSIKEKILNDPCDECTLLIKHLVLTIRDQKCNFKAYDFQMRLNYICFLSEYFSMLTL